MSVRKGSLDDTRRFYNGHGPREPRENRRRRDDLECQDGIQYQTQGFLLSVCSEKEDPPLLHGENTHGSGRLPTHQSVT